jgi:hypothetical protein
VPTLELLQNVGPYPASIYLSGLFSLFFTGLVAVYYVFVCLYSFVRR